MVMVPSGFSCRGIAVCKDVGGKFEVVRNRTLADSGQRLRCKLGYAFCCSDTVGNGNLRAAAGTVMLVLNGVVRNMGNGQRGLVYERDIDQQPTAECVAPAARAAGL